eukprot:2880645-Rhodomonas_salina.1
MSGAFGPITTIITTASSPAFRRQVRPNSRQCACCGSKSRRLACLGVWPHVSPTMSGRVASYAKRAATRWEVPLLQLATCTKKNTASAVFWGHVPRSASARASSAAVQPPTTAGAPFGK